MGDLTNPHIAADIPVDDVMLNPDGSGSAVITGLGHPETPTYTTFFVGSVPQDYFENIYGPSYIDQDQVITYFSHEQFDGNVVYDNPSAVLYIPVEDFGVADPHYEIVSSQPYEIGEVVTFTPQQYDFDGPACYVRGTLIRTARGELPIQHLEVDDLIWTNHHGLLPITWIGRRDADSTGVPVEHLVDFWPIKFQAGSLGRGVPYKDLMVSPCHAMIVNGECVPAWKLVNEVSITRATYIRRAEYLHIELPIHSVIMANGALSESFFQSGDLYRTFDNADTYRPLPGLPLNRLPERIEEFA